MSFPLERTILSQASRRLFGEKYFSYILFCSFINCQCILFCKALVKMALLVLRRVGLCVGQNQMCHLCGWLKLFLKNVRWEKIKIQKRWLSGRLSDGSFVQSLVYVLFCRSFLLCRLLGLQVTDRALRSYACHRHNFAKPELHAVPIFGNSLQFLRLARYNLSFNYFVNTGIYEVFKTLYGCLLSKVNEKKFAHRA